MTVAELIAELQKAPQDAVVVAQSLYHEAWIDANLETDIVAVRLPQTEEHPFNNYLVFGRDDPDDDMLVFDDDCSFVNAVAIW